MAMNPAYDTALNDLLQEVIDFGSARISERNLLRYHGAKNISKSIWRDLEQRFQDAAEANDEDWGGYWLGSLRLHGYLTLVAMEPLNQKPEDFWWGSVAKQAGVPWNNQATPDE